MPFSRPDDGNGGNIISVPSEHKFSCLAPVPPHDPIDIFCSKLHSMESILTASDPESCSARKVKRESAKYKVPVALANCTFESPICIGYSGMGKKEDGDCNYSSVPFL